MKEKKRIKERKDLMFPSNAAHGRVSKYLPDKYVACYAQGLSGRGSHCYLQQPRDLHTKHTALHHAGGVYERLPCCAAHVPTFRMSHCMIPKK